MKKNPILLIVILLGMSCALDVQAQNPPIPPGRPMTGPVPHQSPGPGIPAIDPFRHNLIPPEMIVAHQGELKLTPEQSQAIREILTSSKSEVTGLEWDLREAVKSLDSFLSGDDLNEDEALKRLNSVLEIEGNIKRRILTVAIQLKEQLTDEQRKIIDEKKKALAKKQKPPAMDQPHRHGGQKMGPGTPKPPQPGMPGKRPLPEPANPGDKPSPPAPEQL